MKLNGFNKVLAGAGLVIVMAGCSSKKDNVTVTEPTTVEQDKKSITDTRNLLFNCVKNIKDGQLIQSLINTAGLKNGDFGNEDWLNSITDALDVSFNYFELEEGGRFNYARFAGNYNWDAATKKFIKTAAADITVSFPSSPTGTTNNYVVKMSTYKDGKYQVNMKDVYLPTAVKATCTKDGQTILSLDLAAVFSNGSFPIPQSIVLNLGLMPHNYLIKVNKITNTQFNVVTELQSGSDCVTALNAKVTFANEDYNNLELSEDLQAVEGTISKGDLSLQGSWNAAAYYKLSGHKAEDINGTFALNTFSKEQKIGELKLKNINNHNELVIFYKDQTSEAFNVYTDPFIADLKTMLKPYFGSDIENWFERTAQSNGSFSKKITRLKTRLSEWINK
ncbi:hypothetical protein [Chitinophaga nivalis]|uniref:Uncharacterized protein n=1 Tax=Chitinophaga nivalis TaxID=2991709 RepID=A0ABT3IUY0_9BACT|nr:hypothetical protein [Chitinophaga nivalis]MCW3462561.1 hypothetical protein [Chitinophaga nivalis]MCW3487748.1 hypothetical protein [Chitinophaga nivalis]